MVQTSSLSCLPDPHTKGRRRSSVFEHLHIPYPKALSDKVEDRNSVAAIFVLSSRLNLLHFKFIRCQHTPRKNLFTHTLYSMQGKILRYFGNNCKYVRTYVENPLFRPYLSSLISQDPIFSFLAFFVLLSLSCRGRPRPKKRVGK